MSNLDDVKHLLERMDAGQLREVHRFIREKLPKHAMEERLMTSAEGILEAFARAGDLTIRMIRGVIAEASFASEVLPTLSAWRQLPLPSNDPPFDFLLTDLPDPDISPPPVPYPKVRVQVKMQRSEAQQPLAASSQWKTLVSWPANYYVAEVQKSRKGEKAGKNTRPYRFGEFDILAVSLGPARGRWAEFTYTVESWLLPNPLHPDQLLKYQPVPPNDEGGWTSDFSTAVGWLRSGEKRLIAGDLPKLKGSSPSAKQAK